MRYDIRVYKVDKADSKLKGFVSATFENAFCAKSIALKESGKGNLYVEMPKYLDYETQEYLPFFTMLNGDFRKEFLDNVVEAYHEITDKMADKACAWGDEEMYYDISVSPIRGNDTFKAEASMKIQNVFAVQQMHIIKAWNGNTFVGMPQRENTQSGKKEDIAHPVTGEFKQELEATIMDCYQKKLGQQQRQQHNAR